MANFYVYLISSLPALHFGSKPPFSFEYFSDKCREFIPQKDADIIGKLNLSAELSMQKISVITKWLDFETMLRNELVKLRALRKKINPDKYIRPDGYAGSSIYHIALAAQRSPSPLEGERILDEARWNYLEELAAGHYFDLEFLVVYGLKLLVLERWGEINGADKGFLLENLIINTDRG